MRMLDGLWLPHHWWAALEPTCAEGGGGEGDHLGDELALAGGGDLRDGEVATGEGNTATLGGVELPEAEGGGGEGEPGGGGGGGQVEGGLVAGAQGVALVEPVVAGERGGGGAGGAGQGGKGWGGGK